MRRNEKKGMSLIVLVITIIIMIILASAIILSLNDTNIIGRAEEARTLSDNTNKRQAANIALGEYLLEKELNPNIEQTAEQFVMEKLAAQGIDTTNIAVAGNKVIVGSGASAIKQGVNIGEYVVYY